MKKALSYIQNNIKETIFWSAAVSTGLLILFFLGQQGPVLMNDSLSYMQGAYEREPFYPVFIKMATILCGGIDGGLVLVYCLQGIVALISCICLLHTIRDRFEIGVILSSIFWVLLLLPFFFDSFLSERIVYSHAIMTECLSYSMFYFYVSYLIRFLDEGKMRFFIIMTVITIFMTMNRNQLLIVHGVSAIAAVYVHSNSFRDNKVRLRLAKEKQGSELIAEKKKSFWACTLKLLILVFAYAMTILLSLAYCKVSYGLFEKSSENSFTFATNLIYLSNADDENIFASDGDKQVFHEIYELIEEHEYNYKYAGLHSDGQYGKEKMYSDSGVESLNLGKYMSVCHDRIKSTILRPYFNEYVTKLGFDERDYEADQIKKTKLEAISRGLLREHFWEYVSACMSTWPYGFAYDVLPVFLPNMDVFMCSIGLIVWLAFLIGFWLLLRNKELRKQNAFLIALVICIGAFVVVNTLSVSFVIFYVTRYLNYTQGLIWIAAVLVWRTAIIKKQNEHG